MRIFFLIFLSTFMTSCVGQGYNPQAGIDIRASADDQAQVIETIKRFGQQNGFEVSFSDGMPGRGRVVTQIDLQRGDGVMTTTDNFLKADTLRTSFYAKKPDADWRSVKDAWLRAVTEALNGRGEIIERRVDAEPNAIEEERKKRSEDDNHY